MLTRKNPLFFWADSLHKPTLFASIALILIGVVVSFSISYAASEKIGLKSLTFFIKHIVFAGFALLLIFLLSVQSTERLKWLSFIAMFLIICALIMTLFSPDIKGSRRWLNLGGFSLQPSEFLKPFYIYTFSFLFSLIQVLKIKSPDGGNANKIFALMILLHSVIVFLFFLQPDFGMIIAFSLLFLAFFYINLKSIKKFFIGALALLALAFIIAFFLPHVQNRVKTFLFGMENYQSKLAMQAVQNGGFFGKGIAESQLKFSLPEAHNDFIFAIIIEEFGFIFAIILGLIFIFLVFSNFLYVFDFKEKLLNMFARVSNSSDRINEEGVADIIRKNYKTPSGKNYLNIYYDFLFTRNFIFITCILIFFEFFFNASVSLNLVPTKGMAMPFISYGGSSLISHGILIGFLLAFNRKRYFFLI